MPLPQLSAASTDVQQLADAATVAAVVGVLAAGAIAASPSAAASIAQMGVIGKVSSCDPRVNESLDFYQSPIPLAIMLSDADDKTVQYHVGAFVVNAVIILLMALFSLLVGGLHYNIVTRRGFRNAVQHRLPTVRDALGPGALALGVLSFGQALTSSAVSVFARGSAAARAFAAVVLCALVFVVLVFWWTICRKTRFGATWRDAAELKAAQDADGEKEASANLLDFAEKKVRAPYGEWFDVPALQMHSADPQEAAKLLGPRELREALPTMFVRRWSPVFDAYHGGRQWFVVIEFGTVLLLGVCDGLLSDLSVSCENSGWAVIAILGAYAVAHIALRPMATRIDTACAAVMSVLKVAASLVAVASAADAPTAQGPKSVASIWSAVLLLGTFQAMFASSVDVTRWLFMSGQCDKRVDIQTFLRASTGAHKNFHFNATANFEDSNAERDEELLEVDKAPSSLWPMHVAPTHRRLAAQAAAAAAGGGGDQQQQEIASSFSFAFSGEDESAALLQPLMAATEDADDDGFVDLLEWSAAAPSQAKPQQPLNDADEDGFVHVLDFESTPSPSKQQQQQLLKAAARSHQSEFAHLLDFAATQQRKNHQSQQKEKPERADEWDGAL